MNWFILPSQPIPEVDFDLIIWAWYTSLFYGPVYYNSLCRKSTTTTTTKNYSVSMKAELHLKNYWIEQSAVENKRHQYLKLN